MTVADFLRRLVVALDVSGVPYMVAGSFAAVVHGLPRTTYDVDLVIDPDLASLDRLIASLDPEAYYLDAEVARDALRRRSMFNVIDLATGWKADLMIRKDRAFSRQELARRAPSVIAGVPCLVATPEDTILSKLEWAKASGSERQLEDVAGIVAVSGATIDLEYIVRWAITLGVTQQWAAVRTVPP